MRYSFFANPPFSDGVKLQVSALFGFGVAILAPFTWPAHPAVTVGATSGSYQVSPSGAFTYTIPIAVTPRCMGMGWQIRDLYATMTSFFLKQKGVDSVEILNRGPLGGAFGLPFDVVDIILGYQGLPTASFRDYVNSGLYGRSVSGHSLGTLNAMNAYRLGMAVGGGRLDSVPFGNIAPTALQVNLGTGDLVNGGFLGKIFNPGARMRSMGPTGHPHATYMQVCP